MGDAIDDHHDTGVVVSRTITSLVLWSLSLGTMALADYVGFGESGVRDTNPVVGMAAAFLGVVAVVVAVSDSGARIGLGLALTVQALTISAAGFVPGFRFVWVLGDREFTLLVAVVACVALWLLSTSVASTQSTYARSSSSSWSTETRLRVRHNPSSPEVWMVVWAVLAVAGALLGHDLGDVWDHGTWGMVGGLALVGLAHQVLWWAGRRRTRNS